MAGPIVGRNTVILVDQSPGANAAASPIVNAKTFSLDSSRDKYDVTAFGATSKATLVGLPGNSGQIGAFADTDGSHYKITDGNARKWYAYMGGIGSGKDYYFGTALFDVNTSSDVGGVVEASMSWSGYTDLCHAVQG